MSAPVALTNSFTQNIFDRTAYFCESACLWCGCGLVRSTGHFLRLQIATNFRWLLEPLPQSSPKRLFLDPLRRLIQHANVMVDSDSGGSGGGNPNPDADNRPWFHKPPSDKYLEMLPDLLRCVDTREVQATADFVIERLSRFNLVKERRADCERLGREMGKKEFDKLTRNIWREIAPVVVLGTKHILSCLTEYLSNLSDDQIKEGAAAESFHTILKAAKTLPELIRQVGVKLELCPFLT